MELCKFYLLECCAKGERCSYLHGDFPCKYYYLGLNCINKDCKFLHGKPLSDKMKDILLKHLELAPKDILGDFPRMNRNHALGMLNVRHTKLLVEYGMEPEKVTAHIPSLLDMVVVPPEPHMLMKNDDMKQRKSRWLPNNNSGNSNNTNNSNNNNNMNNSNSTSLNKDNNYAKKPNLSNSVQQHANYLSIRNLTGVLSTKQIDELESIGIESVHQINHLTVAQLNEIGLSLAQISEIQLNSLNLQKLLNQKASNASSDSSNQNQLKNTVMANNSPFGISGQDTTNEEKSVAHQVLDTSKDVDLRQLLPAQTTRTPSADPFEDIGAQDVDMRVMPNASVPPPQIQSPEQNTIMSPNPSEEIINKNLNLDLNPTETVSVAASSPAQMKPPVVDYSQYLRDSNLNDDNEDDDELKIDESTFMHSDQDEDKKVSQIF